MNLDEVRTTAMSLVLDCENIPHKKGKALCPFHTEKTPSFTFRKNLWHCFGCGDGGDTIKFIQKYKGLDFINAVKTICEFAGLPYDGTIKRNHKKDAIRENKKQLLNILKEEENSLIDKHRHTFTQSFRSTRDYTKMLWCEERLNEIGQAKWKLQQIT